MIRSNMKNDFHPQSMDFYTEKDRMNNQFGQVEEGQTYIIDMNGNTIKKIGNDSEDDVEEIEYLSFFDRDSKQK